MEDITSLTVEEEKRKKGLAKERLKNKGKNLNKKEQQSSHRKKYYIPLERNDQHEVFRDQGFAISFNPAGDGNCQFTAVGHALQDVGICRSNETLRREVLQYLSDNPNAADGSPLALFAAMPWAEYLNTMAQNLKNLNRRICKEFVLTQREPQAPSNIWNVNIPQYFKCYGIWTF